MAAAALIVSSQFLRLIDGLLGGPDSATIPVHTLTCGLALAGMYVLLLALTAVYAGQHGALRRLGLAGYLVAALGTLLVAGDWWFEAFAVPMIGAHAPDVLTLPPGGSLLAGAVITSTLFAIGWILFGVAALRSGAFSRPAAVLLIVGGAFGFLALSTPYQVPLAVAVGWIGYTLRRRSQLEVPVVPATRPASELTRAPSSRHH
jgi:hypothetical protein